MRLRDHKAKESVMMSAREMRMDCYLLRLEKTSAAGGRFADSKVTEPNLMVMHRCVGRACRRMSALWYLWDRGNSHMHEAIHASKAEKMAHIYNLPRRHQ
jgi:hypothetical protein